MVFRMNRNIVEMYEGASTCTNDKSADVVDSERYGEDVRITWLVYTCMQ